ncbi:Uncharacterised protein [Mycobacteroides abscessus subsp. abscessus]|nr:Uncharacterised protein [Mycobacteroides abscessus subsp. abscessus]
MKRSLQLQQQRTLLHSTRCECNLRGKKASLRNNPKHWVKWTLNIVKNLVHKFTLCVKQLMRH